MAISPKLDRLTSNVPIVDPTTGNPTPLFQRLIEQLLKEKEITDALADAAVPGTRLINSGNGLTGGGDLSADRTLAVGAGTGIGVHADDVYLDAVLDNLNDVDTTTTPPTNGQALVYNAGSSLWVPGAGAGGGGGGSPWTLHGSSAATGSAVNFTGLAGSTDILVIGRSFTQSLSGVPLVQVSVDNGASYFSASGNYIALTNDTGVEANTTGFSLMGTSATAARSGTCWIAGADVLGTPRMGFCPGQSGSGNWQTRLFVADTTNDIDAIRLTPSAGGTFGAGTFYVFKRMASGTGGGMTLISEQSPTGVASVTFSSIPQTYRDLKLVVRGRGTTAAASVNVLVKLNNDASAIYDLQRVSGINAAASAGTALAATSWTFGWMPAASAAAGIADTGEYTIFDYRGTTFEKSGRLIAGGRTGTTAATQAIHVNSLYYRSTSAINRIDVSVGAGNFATGTVISLYGLM